MSRLMRVVVLFLSALTLVSIVSVLRAALPNVQTSQWAASGNLQKARSGAAAVLLTDGRLLITGGDVAGAPATSVEMFNPDGSFSAASPMSVARSGHAAVLLATGDVLVTGGRTSGGGITNSAEVFDPTNNTWTAAPGMHEARAGHATAQLPDYSIIIVGGVSSSGPVSAVERYSFWDGTFVHAGVLNHPRADAAVAVLDDGRVLVAGGTTMDAQDQSSPSALVEIFDPANSVSADGPSLSSARAGASATTLLDGRVAVIGGSNGADLASAEIYDPAAGAWSTVAGGAPRSHHLAVLLPNNNAVLITGGSGTAATDLFVPWANNNAGAFQATSPSLVSHSNGVAVPLSEEGLLFAGTGDSGPATELYRFATVKTDQPDYAPGTTVIITGSGWKPGETVTLTLVETPLTDTHPAMTAVADGNGNIFNDQFSPDSHDIGILFYLTASGSGSGLSAQTSFMDGNVKVNPQPGNATFTLTSRLFTASSNCTGASNAPVSQPVSGPTTFPAAAGQSILLQASATGTKNPSGTVTFGSWRSSDPFTFNPATPATICVAGFSGNGNQNYAANYDGLTKLAFTSAAINVNAGQCSSSLSVQSQDASNVGTNPVVAFTVGLSSTSGGGQFFQSTDATCSLAAISSVNIPTSSNTASFRYKDSNGGSPVITASPQGTTIASASQTETVISTHNTTTSVSCTPNPVALTVPTTCTASVSDTSVSGATSPGGSVSFASSGTGAFSSPGTSCTLSGVGTTTSCSVQYTPALGSAGTPTITGNYGGDSTHNTSSGTFSLTVGKLTPAFSNLSSPTITYGAASTTLSGKISASTQIPTGSVSITLNSVTHAAAIQSDGTFSSSFTTSALTVISPGPTYSISYHYGGDANFSAVSPDGTGTLTVSAVSVTATLTASDKTYDGTNVATITGCSLTGVLAGDAGNVNCSGSGATFASANASASPQTVTATVSLSGTASGNYLLSSSAATTTAKINPKQVTASITASDKTYDGTNAATITGCSLTGVLAGDAANVSCSGSSATFASAHASASPQTVTATVSLSGTASGNYVLSSSTATTTAKINQRPITVTADPQTKVYGTPDPAL
ncbi:MAG: kelch repeat-containing protein, partial [Candidatus Angelobacter sp.]